MDSSSARSSWTKDAAAVEAKPASELEQEPKLSSKSTETVSWTDKIRQSGKFDWLIANWNLTSLKPVIRSAITAWISLVLFVIPSVERWMGQASVLILIGAFMSPPYDPFVGVLEREFCTILFVCIAWAWSCLGMKLASLARNHVDYNVVFLEAIDGRYIEAGPSAIIGVFIAIGTMFILFVKARQGPGPYLFASIFGCICLDICLTTAALYPYPFYNIGRGIILPLGIHSAIALTVSLFIFPETITSQFASRLQAVYSPLASVLQQHATVLQLPTREPEFTSLVGKISVALKKSEGGLVGVAAAGRLLESDLTFCRFSPGDLLAFQGFLRRITGSVHGLSWYFTLIEKGVDLPLSPSAWKHDISAASATPVVSLSRPHSNLSLGGEKGRNEGREMYDAASSSLEQLPNASEVSSIRSRVLLSQTSLGKPSKHHHHHHHHHRHLQNPLQTFSLNNLQKKAEHVVGVFESQKYLDLEAKHFRDPKHEEWVQMETELLGIGCSPLLTQCSESLAAIDTWLGSLQKGKFTLFSKDEYAQDRARLVETLVEFRTSLSAALARFKDHDRHRILEPYRPVDHGAEDGNDGKAADIPPRYLFHCYMYQYHLIQASDVILQVLDEAIRLESERKHARVWAPVPRFFRWSSTEVPENAQHIDDDDPNIIQGVSKAVEEDLGLPKRRDPDALPPRNFFESLMNVMYYGARSLASGDSLFAMKAGIVTAALCLPSLMRDSSAWAYKNRWVWAIVMCQLGLARFRGDTTVGIAARITATLAGGLIGMVIWYISAGSGTASPYAFAAVCGVAFPICFMLWLYFPIPPMTRIVAFVTATLVFAYSYQDTRQFVPNSAGAGWEVAWRRFVLVTIGLVAAFFASLLPPTMSLRQYQRSLLATTCTELGAIYCTTISFASDKNETTVQEIISSLLATRAKLNRSADLWTSVLYEVSLRGRWPMQRYQLVLDLQIGISYSLTNLLSVFEHMEPSWTSALLRQGRLLDPDFQGDVLAVISMISSSLRTGNPLPQVTPCPLLDRFMARYQGLDVIHRDSEEDYGLPRLMTLETMKNEQMFCVGISSACSIMNRLDQLMLATKEIVGEQYHIHGIAAPIPMAAALDSKGQGRSATSLISGVNLSQDTRPLRDV